MTSDKKTRFLDAAEIERGIGEVARLAAAQGVHVALIGGAALQIFGSSRLTADIDFAAERVVDGMTSRGPIDFGGEKLITASGVPVDLVVRDDKYRGLYEAALQHARSVRGVSVPVVGAEYLIAMKMAAGRPRDDLDLDFLIGESGIDIERARAIVEEHLGPYAVDELDRYRDVVAWQRSRDGE